VRVVPGTYADYVVDLQTRARQSSSPKKADAPKSAEDAAAAHAARNRKKNAEKALRAIEARMATRTQERAAMLAEIERDSAAVRHDLYERLGATEKDLAALEQEWLEQTAKIEALNG